jgi:hypothetical protein
MKSQQVEKPVERMNKKPQDDNEKKEDPIAIDKKRMDIAKQDFKKRLEQYLDGGNPMFRGDKKENEFEIRFGTNTQSGRQLSKINYDNVVKQLLSNGFKTDNQNGIQMLRINYQDSLSDERKMSNIRAEIVGIDLIQEYCRSNSIQKISDMTSNIMNKLKFTKKSSTKDANDNWQKPIDMFDMNFRVSYQLEQSFGIQVPFIKSVVDTWSDRKKTFRLLNRVRFEHPDFPIFADLSIIRSSKKFSKNMAGGGGGEEGTEMAGLDGLAVGGAERRFIPMGTNVPVPKYTIQEAGVFENVETYEIELEMNNEKLGNGTIYNTPEKVMNVLRQCIRIVLSGIQQCYYPISFTERDIVLNSYMKTIRNNDKDYQYKKIKINDKREFFSNFSFIGPGSITLQREHVLPKKEGSLYANVLENYTVTDKADGDRKLLFINEEGRIYLIDNNFNVEFSGMKTEEKTIYNSILDGEHIKIDKNGEPLNLYAAFDVYYINNKSVREKLFYPDLEGELENNYRLPLLQEVVSSLKPSSIVGEKTITKWTEKTTKKGEKFWFDAKNGEITKIKPKMEYSCKLIIQCKQFQVVSPNKNVFECCSNILKNVEDKLFKYHTDGLIFTPTNTGVGGTGHGLVGPLNNSTWELSFKWKPVEQNTVDFLVTIKKDKTGKDEIINIFQDGVNTLGNQIIEQYKTLELMCGYNEKEDGFMNPYQDMLNDNIPLPSTKTGLKQQDYRAELFIPSDPYDVNAYISKIKLKNDGSNLFMTSEEGDYFEEFNIVEFRYDKNMPVDMRWVPLRVRYDKTQKLKNGEKQFGNAYRVANSNWRSIHYPVTTDMITTGENIPDLMEDEGVYYKSNNQNNTQGLRDFHNLFVKKKLIMGVSNRDDTLIDYAVGMAGDLAKWTASKLSFVFGIDVSHQNIHNRKRGACARYLNLRKDNNSMPKAIFLVGDSGLNIRDLKAFTGNKDAMVANAIFGKGSKDATIIGKATVAQYGIGENGFNISSCQFAIHYFFENPIKFHGFMRNMSECTKINGYFVGTCYDGKSIFKMLQKKKDGESVSFNSDDNNGNRVKICEICKRYNDTGFPDDETSLGYAIDVYQESINNIAREYLVNFNYLEEMMSNYGFVLITKDEALQMKMPNNSGLFSELYEDMKQEIKRNPRHESDYKNAPFMSSIEKSLSFLNRYFIFKKTTNVDANKIAKMFLKGANTINTAIEMDEIEAEFTKTIKKQRAIRGEFKKTKMRTKLRKSELFSVVDSDNYLDVNTDADANISVVNTDIEDVDAVNIDADVLDIDTNAVNVDVDADANINVVNADADVVDIDTNAVNVDADAVNVNNKTKKNSLYIDYGSNVNVPNIKSSIAKRFKR